MTTPTALTIGETRFPFHDFDETGSLLEAAIGDAANVTNSTEKADLADLSGYDLVVDYLTDSTFTDDQRDGLLGFIAGGGGYLGVHCAADLTSVHDGDGRLNTRDEPVSELRDMLGGHFLTHPEQETFVVSVVDEHPVVDGVDDFEVFDEPYQVVADDVNVLARMDHPDLTDYPVVWTRQYGSGRVCYASLGHTADAFANDDYRRILRNAVTWVVNA